MHKKIHTTKFYDTTLGPHPSETDAMEVYKLSGEVGFQLWDRRINKHGETMVVLPMREVRRLIDVLRSFLPAKRKATRK